jgi:urease accessory protein
MANFDITSTSNRADALGAVRPPEARGNPFDKDLQRAQGSGRIVLGGSENGTRIMSVFQQSPIRVMFPNLGSGAVEEAVLVNIAGGTAGGDQLEYMVTALSGASIAVTSQAAEKVYRALSEPARVTTKLTACETAKLAWLPQETIVFDRARLRRETEINFASGAEMLALEWLVLGRAAHGEDMVGGQITDSWRVKKDGRLVWADSFRITDDIFPHLHRKALLWDYKALATLVYFGAFLDKGMEFSRAIGPSLECDCATTSVAELMVVRFAARAASDLRSALRGFLERFSKEVSPGPFRVPKMWSC